MLLGARQFFERRGAPTPPLPYDAEVEYLEITRYDSGAIGPYIDTGVVVRPTDKVSVDWQGLSTWANDLKFFGSYLGYGWASFYGRVWRPVIGNFISSSATRDTNRHSIVFENYTCNLDGVAIASGSGNFSNISFYLFAMNGQSLTSARLEQRVYSLAIERDGVKIIDFVPVRFTNEQGVSEGAMYDRVSGQLFRNAGTGNFIVGRDINPISARSYVNDGLIAMWDGIENAGWGTHDSEATTWRDLVANHNLLLAGVASFSDNSLICPSSSTYSATGSALSATIVQMEICLKCETAFTDSINRVVASFGPGMLPGLSLQHGNGLLFYGGSNAFRYDFGNKTFSASAQIGSVETCYINGSQMTERGASDTWWNFGNNVFIGNYTSGMRPFVGQVHSIRLYSRALTAADIAANYAIDKARFNLP